jgi:hypothetical protein
MITTNCDGRANVVKPWDGIACTIENINSKPSSYRFQNEKRSAPILPAFQLVRLLLQACAAHAMPF